MAISDTSYWIWRCPKCKRQKPYTVRGKWNQCTNHSRFDPEFADNPPATSPTAWPEYERVKVVVPEEALTEEMVANAYGAYLRSDYASNEAKMRDALLAAGPWTNKERIQQLERELRQCAGDYRQECDIRDELEEKLKRKPEREHLVAKVQTLRIRAELAANLIVTPDRDSAERIVDALLEEL